VKMEKLKPGDLIKSRLFKHKKGICDEYSFDLDTIFEIIGDKLGNPLICCDLCRNILVWAPKIDLKNKKVTHKKISGIKSAPLIKKLQHGTAWVVPGRRLEKIEGKW